MDSKPRGFGSFGAGCRFVNSGAVRIRRLGNSLEPPFCILVHNGVGTKNLFPSSKRFLRKVLRFFFPKWLGSFNFGKAQQRFPAKFLPIFPPETARERGINYQRASAGRAGTAWGLRVLVLNLLSTITYKCHHTFETPYGAPRPTEPQGF